MRWTGVTIRHTGYTDAAPLECNLQRDCKILDSERAERPDDPFVLFNKETALAAPREQQPWANLEGPE